MNLVILNDFGYINGGAAQVAINTALMMARKGHKVYYVYAVNPVDERLTQDENIITISTNQQDILRNTNQIKAILQGLWNRKSARVINELLLTLPIENTIFHIHGWTKALSHSSIYPAIKQKYKIVLSMHDYFVSCPNGGFYNYQTQSICPLKALSPKCILTHCDSRSYSHKIWRVIRSLIQKHIVKIPAKIQHFISMSSLSSTIISPYLPPDANIHLLPSNIDIQKSDRIPVEKNHKFIAIGRLSPEKGFDLVAKAAKKAGVQIAFIGDGPEKLNLQNLNPQAEFYGWLSRDELFKFLKEARCLIFSSKLYETQGLVISEAASLGIPGIVSDISAASESIKDQETGKLFRTNDLGGLTEKIIMMKDDELVNRLGMNAYNQYWNDPNTSESYTNKLENIFRNILNKENIS